MKAKRVVKLFRDFRESEPRRAAKIHIRVPRAMIFQGYVELIAYVTKHGKRKIVPYAHEFHPGSRPILGAGPGRGELFLIGRGYRVTGRGIVDVDHSGRPRAERVPKYAVVPRAWLPPSLRRKLDGRR